MKKVLFATTALVLAASAASAEVAVSGTARMGIVDNGLGATFSSRARVAFALSGETDGGLGFGAGFRADQAANANTGTEGTVFISGAFGKIEMGDVVSAPEALFGDLAAVGYTGINDYTDIPYLTGDDSDEESILYTYTAGAASVAVGLDDGRDDVGVDANSANSIAAAYAIGNYTVGLGYENADNNGANAPTEQTELAATATFGETAVKAYYADIANDATFDSSAGLSVASKFGATGVTAFYRQDSGLVAADDAEYYGIGASYDLGGGATLAGGIVDGDDTTAAFDSGAKMDLGVKFKF